jgi:predicted ATP-grasp superfamily ATP-dependent carboligase
MRMHSTTGGVKAEDRMSADTPAVVLGAGVNGLGVARSLKRADVSAWLLDTDASRPEMYTRAARPLAIRALHGDTLIEDLVRLGDTQFAGLRPVLFLTQEETVKTVSRHRDQLSALYRLNLPPADVVNTLLRKQGFQRLAEDLGSPIPRLVHVRSTADLPALDGLHYPVVVKPDARDEEYSRRFQKAYRVDNAVDAVALVRRILPILPDIVAQEWIEGRDSDIYFCLQYVAGNGQLAASFTGRKIRSWPPQVGGTASCTAAPEVHRELTDITTRFFQAARVVGMASMEYKRDARTHEFKMVEPTIGRTDYQQEVATLNGINLPCVAWCSELGLPLPVPMASRRQVVWRVRSQDMQSATAQAESLREGYPQGARIADASWRWSDPRPHAMQSLQHLRRALRNRFSKLVPQSQAAGSKP